MHFYGFQPRPPTDEERGAMERHAMKQGAPEPFGPTFHADMATQRLRFDQNQLAEFMARIMQNHTNRPQEVSLQIQTRTVGSLIIILSNLPLENTSRATRTGQLTTITHSEETLPDEVRRRKEEMHHLKRQCNAIPDDYWRERAETMLRQVECSLHECAYGPEGTLGWHSQTIAQLLGGVENILMLSQRGRDADATVIPDDTSALPPFLHETNRNPQVIEETMRHRVVA